MCTAVLQSLSESESPSKLMSSSLRSSCSDWDVLCLPRDQPFTDAIVAEALGHHLHVKATLRKNVSCPLHESLWEFARQQRTPGGEQCGVVARIEAAAVCSLHESRRIDVHKSIPCRAAYTNGNILILLGLNSDLKVENSALVCYLLCP